MSDFLACPPIQRLPVASLHLDPTAPRAETGPIAATDALLGSLKGLGVLTPLVVVRTARHRYLIVAGTRRYRRAVKLGLTTLPCQIHGRLTPRRITQLRVALQATIAPWTSTDTQRAAAAVEATAPGTTLALPKTADALLRRLPASYRVEFQRCRPKLRTLSSMPLDEVIRNLLGRVKRHVITNAQEFRMLGKLFATRKHDRELVAYLKNPGMSVKTLAVIRKTERRQARSVSLHPSRNRGGGRITVAK